MPLKTYEDEQPTLNLTPMIDVVFLLIIFFMVGTKFTDDERKIELDLPAVGQSAALTAAPQKRVVYVLRDGTIRFNRQIVDLPRLTELLATARQQTPQLSVAVRGDAQGAFQNVANVLAACRTAGVHDMAISVRMAGDAGSKY